MTEYKQLFPEEKHQPNTFLITENDDESADIYVFDTVEEMDKSSITVQSNVNSNMQLVCDDWSNPGQGTANYTFYKDVDYVNEFTDLS